MKNFHIKSVILGIGIGAILTSLIAMIYMAGYSPNNAKMTNEQIIERAKVLGMLEPRSILEGDNPGDAKIEVDTAGTNTADKKNSEAGNDIKKVTPKPVTPVPNTPVPNFAVDVVKGDTSEKVAQKLYDAKLIEDKDLFINEITKQGLSMEINIGHYKIDKGTDINKIIKLLTSAD